MQKQERGTDKMIEYYQELLNECIDIAEHKRTHKIMLLTLAEMQDKFKNRKEDNIMRGKHTEESIKIKQLEETIAAKDREIKDIKFSLADILLKIRTINESNDCGDPSVKRRKISELCTDTRYELLIDEIDEFYKKDKAKIIKLPTTDQSNR